MSNILAGLVLVLISVLPSTAKLENWENSLRSRIDTPQEDVFDNPIEKIPEEIEAYKELTPSSKAAYFVDTTSGKVLIKKNSKEKLPPASIAKLMTALVVVSEIELDEVLTIKPQETQLGDSTMGLVVGDKLTVYELLHGLLINSGSDAALNLAEHVAESEQEFVALMNEKATILGLEGTQFTNPVGWDENGNYSTAKDLSVITSLALTNKTISNIVSKKSHIAKSELGRSYILSNTNLLLNNSAYKGTKTGTTYRAGQCLATYYNDGTRVIVGVVLNSPQRFTETDRTIKWIRSNYIY